MRMTLIFTLLLALGLTMAGCNASKGFPGLAPKPPKDEKVAALHAKIDADNTLTAKEKKSLKEHGVSPEVWARVKENKLARSAEVLSLADIEGLHQTFSSVGPLDPNTNISGSDRFGTGKGSFPVFYAHKTLPEGAAAKAEEFASWRTFALYGRKESQSENVMISRRDQEAFLATTARTWVSPGMTKADLAAMVKDGRLTALPDGSYAVQLGFGSFASAKQDTTSFVSGQGPALLQIRFESAYFVLRIQPVMAGDMVVSTTNSVGGLWFKREVVEQPGLPTSEIRDQGFIPARNGVVVLALTQEQIETAFASGKITAVQAAAAIKAVSSDQAATNIRSVFVPEDHTFDSANLRVQNELESLKFGQPGSPDSSWKWLSMGDKNLRLAFAKAENAHRDPAAGYREMLAPFAGTPLSALADATLAKCQLIERASDISGSKADADSYAADIARYVLYDPLFFDNARSMINRTGGRMSPHPTDAPLSILAGVGDYSNVDNLIRGQCEDLAEAFKGSIFSWMRSLPDFPSQKCRNGAPQASPEQQVEWAGMCGMGMLTDLFAEKAEEIRKAEGDGPAEMWLRWTMLAFKYGRTFDDVTYQALER